MILIPYLPDISGPKKLCTIGIDITLIANPEKYAGNESNNNFLWLFFSSDLYLKIRNISFLKKAIIVILIIKIPNCQ